MKRVTGNVWAALVVVGLVAGCKSGSGGDSAKPAESTKAATATDKGAPSKPTAAPAQDKPAADKPAAKAKLKHLTVEQQEPGSVKLPIGDTVVKGKFRVEAEKEYEVLSMKSTFNMEWKGANGQKETVKLAEDSYPAPNVSRTDDMQQYPYKLAAGKPQEDFFLVSMESTIPDELKKHNLSTKGVRFFVRTTVEMKDAAGPSDECDITVVEE